MGLPKLLLPYRGGTVAGALVAALREGGASAVVLVTAPGDEELRAWAGGESGVQVAVNPDPGRGMLSSIREGIAALGGAEELARRGEVLLVAPADMPALQPATVAAVLRTALADRAFLTVPIFQGKRGHPLAISPEFLPEIATLDPEVGLRELLDRHASAVVEVPVDDPGAVRDVDTPRDYEALTAESQRR